MHELSISPRARRLLGQLLDLPWEEQLDIADFLQDIHACPPGVLSEDDPDFDAIIQERIRKFESGEEKGIPAEEVFRKLDEKFGFGTATRTKPPAWLDALRERLAMRGSALSNYWEADFQIELCDALTRDGYGAIREYPTYHGSKNTCDLALVSPDDCRKVEEWIEIKSVTYSDPNNWYPGHFLEGAFQGDIRKLAGQPSRRFFLLYVESEDDTFDLSNPAEPQVGGNLYVPNMVQWITMWAGGREPFTTAAFPVGERYGHLFLWPVTEYADVSPSVVDGVYKLVPSASPSNFHD
jgi:hypothetical protein